MTMSYDNSESDRESIITYLLGCKGLHFVQTLTDEE